MDPERDAGAERFLRSPGGRWAVAAALAALALLLYASVAGQPFLFYDDDTYVAANPRVLGGLSWANVGWAFTTLHFSNWHPLTWLSYMLDVELFGPGPGAFHLVNAALHAANAGLLFLVLDAMTGARGRSAAVAALFAVHPIHVESVAWIAERKDVLSTLLGLLAIAAYRRHAARPSAGRYALVAVAFAASLMAKPMLVTLPLLLLLLDGWPLGRVAWPPWSAARVEPPPGAPPAVAWSRALVEKLPLLALAAASSAITVIAQRRWGSLQGLGAVPLAERLGNAAVSYVRYAAHLAWPAELAVFYPRVEGGPPAWQVAGAASLLGLATALAVRALRPAPWLLVGWLWFLGALVPVIGLVQVGGQAMADRYAYVPAIGLYLAVAWGTDAVARRLGLERWLPAAAAVAILALAGTTWRQLGFWTSDEALFRRTLAVTGRNGQAHGALALSLHRQGRNEEALAQARRAAAVEPRNARHWINLGVIARGAGLLDEAGEAFGQATATSPDLARAWVGLADVARLRGDLLGAAAALERAVATDPSDAAAWGDLGAFRQVLGLTAQAGEAFEAAVRADPASFAAWRNLGVYRVQAGRPAEAARAFEEALRLRPGDPEVLWRLAAARDGAASGR